METYIPHERSSGRSSVPAPCGARTRSGAPCRKRPARGRTRCRLHGGASRRGPSHPRWKHGLYSKSVLTKYERQRLLRERAGRKRDRTERAIAGKVAAWWEAGGWARSGSVILRALSKIRREHFQSLEERRRRYHARKPCRERRVERGASGAQGG